jgi:hypothetical protein
MSRILAQGILWVNPIEVLYSRFSIRGIIPIGGCQPDFALWGSNGPIFRELYSHPAPCDAKNVG